MKKFIAAIGITLSFALPVRADKLLSNQPTVRPYSAEAMGCMILLECTEGTEKLSPESKVFEDPNFDRFRDEIKRIIKALDKLEIGGAYIPVTKLAVLSPGS